MRTRWRRRNYFIKKELQGRYIFNFFIFVIAGSFFFTAVFSLLSADTLTITYRNYDLRLDKTPVILLKEALKANWIFILIGGLFVVLASMYLTHRVAGPIYRLEKSLEYMLNGNLNFEIKLRSDDDAKELGQMLDEFSTRLSSQLKEIRDLSDRAESHILSAKEAGADAGAELEKASANNRRIGEIISNYKLKNDG